MNKLRFKPIIFTVFCLFAYSFSAFCQTADTSKRKKIYHVNYLTNSLIIAGGLASDYPAIGRIKGKANLTDAEVLALNTDIINPIDRWALHQNSSQHLMYSKISDYIEVPIYVVLPTLFAFDKKAQKDWLDLLFMYTEGHVITFTFYNYSWFGPTFQNRYRPITYYADLPMNDRTTGNNRNSAYSGHTASVSFTSFFMAKVYCDYHPDLGAKKYLVYTAALIPPVIMGYLRVRALAHFPSDDMVGLSIGAIVGIVLPELHKFNYKGATLGVTSIPGATELNLSWTVPSKK